MEVPHLLQQHLASRHSPFAAQKEFEKAEFSCLERDLLAAAPHSPRQEIQFEIAGLQ